MKEQLAKEIKFYKGATCEINKVLGRNNLRNKLSFIKEQCDIKYDIARGIIARRNKVKYNSKFYNEEPCDI
jgi:hypothetical protein